MERANKFTCPHCGTPLKSARGVHIGRRIKCVKCGTGFTVRPEDAERAEQAAGVNGGRLATVLCCLLLYLLGGTALAVYCFANNDPTRDRSQVASDPDEGTGGSGNRSSLPKPSNVSPAEQRAIDDAISRGVWFLKDCTREPDGPWLATLPVDGSNVRVGSAALPALTLLECGIPASDPIVQKAANYVRETFKQPGFAFPFGTYQRALAILFLDRLGDYQDEGLIQYLALCLVAGQHPTDAAWHYDCPALERQRVGELLASLADEKTSLDDWRKSALKDIEFSVTDWDNSNTQFAILALWVARRHRVASDRCLLFADETHFRPTQMAKQPDPEGNNLDLDGSWYYDRHGPPGWRNSSRWPSMTCAGLLSLAAGHVVTTDAKKKEQKPLDDPAIQRALAMLGREMDRQVDTRFETQTDYYFLWSLERVGVLYSQTKIGPIDWYAWGRKVVLERQQKDGSWREGAYYGSTPVLDTCFALLFLKQANLAEDLSSKLEMLAQKK